MSYDKETFFTNLVKQNNEDPDIKYQFQIGLVNKEVDPTVHIMVMYKEAYNNPKKPVGGYRISTMTDKEKEELGIDSFSCPVSDLQPAIDFVKSKMPH